MNIAFSQPLPSEILGTQYEFKRLINEEASIAEVILEDLDYCSELESALINFISVDYFFIIETARNCRKIKEILGRSGIQAEIRLDYPWKKVKGEPLKFPLYIKRK